MASLTRKWVAGGRCTKRSSRKFRSCDKENKVLLVRQHRRGCTSASTHDVIRFLSRCSRGASIVVSEETDSSSTRTKVEKTGCSTKIIHIQERR